MDIQIFLEGLRSLVVTEFIVIAPIMIACLLVAVVVGIIQAVMQIQEQTLSFFPKLVVLVIILYVLCNWMLSTLSDGMTDYLNLIPELLRG